MKICMLFAFGRYLGVDYIAAFLEQKGHDVSLIMDPFLFHWWGTKTIKKFFSYTPLIVDKVVREKPDLVAFSVISDTYGWALSTAEEIKKKINVPVIFGGVHPSSVPERVIKEDPVDYVCVGEGEEAMLDLVEALKNGEDTSKIPNLWSKVKGEIVKNEPRPLLSNLDSLPFPSMGTYNGEVKDTRWFCGTYSVAATRGCIYKCTYCIHSCLTKTYKGKGPYFRRRSVDNVIEELKYAKKNFKIRTLVILEDEIITNDLKWLKEFCEKYKQEINLPFACQTHPGYLTPEVVQMVETAGCIVLGLGIQTISDQLKKDILHRSEVSENVAEQIGWLKKSRMLLVCNILLDFPGQDEKELLNIARFLNEHRPDLPMFYWFRYYPGTEIVSIAEERGFLSQEEVELIEENKEWKPFTRGCNILYKQEYNSLVGLILVSHILPKRLFNFIYDKELYRHNSFLLRIVIHFYRVIAFVYQFFAYRPKKVMYQLTFLGVGKYLVYSMSRVIFHKIRLYFGKENIF